MYAIRMVKHLLNQSSLLLLYNSILYCFNERIKAWDKERELSLSLVGKKDLKTHQKSWFNAAKLTQQYQFLNAVRTEFKSTGSWEWGGQFFVAKLPVIRLFYMILHIFSNSLLRNRVAVIAFPASLTFI